MWSPYWVGTDCRSVCERGRAVEDRGGPPRRRYSRGGSGARAARGAAAVGTAVVPWGPINLAHCSLRLRGQHLRLARYTLFMAARSALPARILSVVSWAIWILECLQPVPSHHYNYCILYGLLLLERLIVVVGEGMGFKYILLFLIYSIRYGFSAIWC